MKDSMSVSIRLSATTVDKIDKVAERVSDTWGG
jgi:predicted transcriptional regulator